MEAIASREYDFIVANFANPDIVGHTGLSEATIAALEVVDGSLARIVDAVEAVDGSDPAAPGALLAITADHGDADELRDAAGQPVTALAGPRSRSCLSAARRAVSGSQTAFWPMSPDPAGAGRSAALGWA